MCKAITEALEGLIIGPIAKVGMADMDRQEMMDAAHECAHGRLPLDRSTPCGCWSQEIVKNGGLRLAPERARRRVTAAR